MALSALIEGEPGLVLVEAKANVPELSAAGKAAPVEKGDGSSPSLHSSENHLRISDAITEARKALEPALPGISIAADRHYQLSNRLAFAWRLTSFGIPTVLVDLGFTGDEGNTDVGAPFSDDSHWQSVFRDQLRQVCSLGVLDAPVSCGSSKLWLLSRSRPVLQHSTPRVGQQRAAAGSAGASTF